MQHRIAILASGGGSNARKIMEHFASHSDISVQLVAANKSSAGVLYHARDMGIDSWVFKRSDMESELVAKLKAKEITHVVLAGFLMMIPATLLQTFSQRIVNIHPSLLPKYGGKGMYGMHVHRAVKEVEEGESGMTIHLVNEVYDDGRILFQAKTALEQQDSADDIQRKVLRLEHHYYPAVIESWILGKEMPEITH